MAEKTTLEGDLWTAWVVHDDKTQEIVKLRVRLRETD